MEQQCEFQIDMPYDEVRQCSRRATVGLTHAPYGTGRRERATNFYCRQHGEIQKRDFILVAEPQLLVEEGK